MNLKIHFLFDCLKKKRISLLWTNLRAFGQISAKYLIITVLLSREFLAVYKQRSCSDLVCMATALTCTILGGQVVRG